MMIESGAVSKSFPVFCPAPDAEEFFFWEEGWPPMSNQLWLLIIYLFLCVCVEERMSIFVYK